MNTDIFKAYDIRGKVGDELNNDVAWRVGAAMADWLPQPGAVAVGRDMRPDSKELADALIEGLRLQGRDVWDIGHVTSDMIYFAVGKFGLAGGAMVTASHNPGKDNGIKLCREEAKPIGLETGLGDIRDEAEAGNFVPAAEKGTLESRELKAEWITHVMSFIDPDQLTPLKLGVDTGNGMAGANFPLLEEQVPWQVTRLYFELDGSFPNHEANPLKFETLTDLMTTIRDKNLDGGIAFDGDGDRAFLVDETGTVLTGGVMTALLSEYFLKKFPRANIVYDVRNSRSVPEIIAEHGGTPIVCRVGHSPIKVAMRASDAPFGGEASGHFYFRDNWYADSGLIAIVIGLYAATLSGKKLSELRKHYTRYEAIPETNFEVADKNEAIARLKEAFTDGDQSYLDGLSVQYETCWFNVRPSNTESLLRLNAEASSVDELNRLVERVIGIIKA